MRFNFAHFLINRLHYDDDHSIGQIKVSQRNQVNIQSQF